MIRHNRAKEQASLDLDIVHIIKKLRSHSTQLKTILTKSERKMADKLSQKAIMAETSSQSSDDYDNLKLENDSSYVVADKDDSKKFNFLD